jgi:nucleotide-binding universal stress UspA family protein
MSETTKTLLLCFDGSTDAEHAISSAADLLGPMPAVVITVNEPARLWEPSDPATLLDAPIGKLLSRTLELDEIVDEVAQEHMNRGVELARAAGFDARGRVTQGKAWKTICDVADEINAAAIVLGARGLSRVQSALLGSVSAAVSAHANIPVLIIHQRTPSSRLAADEHGQRQPHSARPSPSDRRRASHHH